MVLNLWLVPSEHDAERLRHVMDVRPPSSNETPEPYGKSFYPHITVATIPRSTDFSVDWIASSIPRWQPHIPIKFKSVDVGPKFFSSVYITLEPTERLLYLHADVHDDLHLDPHTPEFPHLSLCYLNNETAKVGEKQHFFHQLERNAKFREEEDGVAINCGDDKHPDWMSGFIANEVWLVNCDGDVEEWSVVKKMRLVDE